MFKKLKEKITEEVKISPQRFAEFTQSVTDRLQNNTSADENFFSIGDDDLNTSTSANSHGFSSVSLVSPSQEEKPRRNSNVSVASDISFLPRYEASNMYQIQSDLDISASELEDNVSSVSSQLGHLTKEQIHSAFQKSQMRYHKYRGRFTDLARHYKDLERENVKMKAILVETQDKAIRRVQELKEQCNLEQKAKAHLESALRDEIDEKDYKIKSLETKIDLLKAENNVEQLIKFEGDGENQNDKNGKLKKSLNDAIKENESLNEKLQEMKANAIIFQTKEQDYILKLAAFEKEITTYIEREKEDNFKLAQSKMELHNEMLIKDTEISNLKRENEILKENLKSLDCGKKNNESIKLEKLQSQNKKLIDKIESLTQKSNNLGKEVLTLESCKIEIKNLKQEVLDLKSINLQLTADKEALLYDLAESEKKHQECLHIYQELDMCVVKEREELNDQITKLRDEARKGLLSLEPKIREKFQSQFLEREKELKREFENKIEELSSNKMGINEIKLQLLLKDDLIKNISEELESLKREITKKTEDHSCLEMNHLELIEDCSRLRNTVSNLEKEKVSLESYEEKIPRLEAHIKTLQDELKESRHLIETNETENIEFNKTNMELQSANEEIQRLHEIVKEQNEEIINLKDQLKFEEEKSSQLNDKIIQINNEIGRLTELLKIYEGQEVENASFKSKYFLLKKNLEKLTTDLFKLKQSVSQTDDSNNTQFESSPNQIIIDINKIYEAKENEIAMLNEKNTKMVHNLNKITEKCRILEEKLETIQIDYTESKILKLTLQKVKEENSNLVEQFEELRKEFNEVIENHKKMQENKLNIDEVQLQLKKSLEENIKLQDNLSSLNINYIQLQEENLNLKNTVSKLEESICSLEATDSDKTQCHILQTKLQNLEAEMINISDSIALERVHFNEAHRNVTIKEKEIKDLTEEHFKIKHSINEYEEELANLKHDLEYKDKLCEDIKIEADKKIIENQSQTESIVMSLKELKDENMVLVHRVNEITDINKELEKELELRDAKIKELSRDISNLSEKLDKHYTENKGLHERIDTLDANYRKNEAAIMESANIKQSELIVKLNELNDIIEQKINEYNKLNENTVNLERLYTEQLSVNELMKQESFNFQNKISNLEDREKKCNAEISGLKNLLHEKENCLNRLKNMEDELKTVSEENNKLVEENAKLQENNKEIGDLKNAKYKVQQQLVICKNELSELKIRCQQITTDYQNILRENQILSDARQELDIKIQEIDKLKLSYEDSKNSVTEENRILKEKLEEINKHLEEVKDGNLKLIAQNKESNSNEVDIDIIKRDFYEIKEKCDSLFVENKNLTQKYSKLEDKCNKFSEMKEKMQNQISLLEKHCTEVLHEKQLLQDEIQELKILPLNLNEISSENKLDQLEILKQEQLLSISENEKELFFRTEIEMLRDKITKYKSLDLTNKSSIDFYENELQKVKNQNDKLNRKLDETLVTLQHCADLSTSTEVEYLKNILYNYMLGKESLVLARVIAAVCKFDPRQTELILQREQQKQTLLGQLGLI